MYADGQMVWWTNNTRRVACNLPSSSHGTYTLDHNMLIYILDSVILEIDNIGVTFTYGPSVFPHNTGAVGLWPAGLCTCQKAY